MTPDYREDRIGSYQTTFRVGRWERGRKTPRVQYRTTFKGPIIDHNHILELVRHLHSEGDGEARALIDIFKDAERWRRFTLNGKNITPEIIEQIEELEPKVNFTQEWAFQMLTMYEDCTYLSLEPFDVAAKKHLAKLVEFVGEWVPPEVRAK